MHPIPFLAPQFYPAVDVEEQERGNDKGSGSTHLEQQFEVIVMGVIDEAHLLNGLEGTVNIGEGAGATAEREKSLDAP